MSNIEKMKQEGFLPSDFIDRLASGIAESRATTILGGGGKPLLRMMKSGKWVFGQNNEPLQEGSRWVINPMSLQHGYCCWVDEGGKNYLAGEIMISMAEPKPPKPEPINGKAYAEQRAFDLRCIDGDDNGTEVRYKINSVGGLGAVDGLLAKMQEQWQTDKTHPCPVITMDSESYQHKKYGETFVPIFDVVGWTNFVGVEAAEEDEDTSAPATPADVRPAKPSLKAVAPEPAPTQRAHTGQRRRPGT